MKRFERIVVPLARTEHDHALIAYARMLAKLGTGRLYQFVHVRTPSHSAGDPAADADVQKECETLVAKEFGEPRPDIRTTCSVLRGVRVDQLIEFSSRSKSELILLGHRRIRSGERSLARRLAMISPCSVWMLPEGAPGAITRVMAPIDFSDNSADSLEMAASITRTAGLQECLAVHVFFDDSTIRYDEHRDEIRRNEQQAFANFLAPIETHAVRVEPAFVEGRNVARTLLRVAEQHGADLLVINTRGRSRAASILLGSVTSQLMVETSVAILAVKHFGAMMHLFEALKESHFWDRPNPKTN